jgi:hypothetical protein
MSTRSDALSRRFATVILGLLTGGVLMSSGCSADRFHNQGCTSDSECRDDRVCEQNACIALSELDRTSDEDEEDPEPTPDAGTDVAPDSGPDDEFNNGTGTETEEERAIQAFVGTWRTDVEGTMRSADGTVSEPPIASSLLVEITHTEGMDLMIEIDHSLICPLEASVRVGPSFELTTEECRAVDGSMTMTYSNIAGRGTLQGNGDLYFNFTSQAAFGSNTSGYDLQLTFEGPRTD